MRIICGKMRSHALWILAATLIFIAACGTANSPFEPFDSSIPADRITISPSDGGINVSVNTLVSISFPSEIELNINTVTGSNIILQERDTGIRISSNVTYDGNLHIALLRPLQSLSGNRQYTLSVQGILTSDGTLFQTKVVSFTTGDEPITNSPEVIATIPIDTQD